MPHQPGPPPSFLCNMLKAAKTMAARETIHQVIGKCVSGANCKLANWFSCQSEWEGKQVECSLSFMMGMKRAIVGPKFLVLGYSASGWPGRFC